MRKIFVLVISILFIFTFSFGKDKVKLAYAAGGPTCEVIVLEVLE